MLNWLKHKALRLVRTGSVPKHVAFIMDGNRRWATKSGMKKFQGHSYGLEKLLEVLEWCLELGIGIVTVYAFSTDNFKRPDEEVNELMRIFLVACEKLSAKKSEVIAKGVKIRIIGDLEGFPAAQQEALRNLEKETEHHNICTLNICLGYGSAEEIVKAITGIKEKIDKGVLTAEEVNQSTFESELMVPEPVDLMVRTGESRLSNFLLYQSSQKTKFMMITDVLWPELKVWHMVYIMFSYQFLL